MSKYKVRVYDFMVGTPRVAEFRSRVGVKSFIASLDMVEDIIVLENGVALELNFLEATYDDMTDWCAEIVEDPDDVEADLDVVDKLVNAQYADDADDEDEDVDADEIDEDYADDGAQFDAMWKASGIFSSALKSAEAEAAVVADADIGAAVAVAEEEDADRAAGRLLAAGLSPEALASGTAWRAFTSFADGVAALCRVSYSALDSIRHNMPYEQRERNAQAWLATDVVASLAINAAFDRPTGNGVNWGRCRVSINAHGVDYMTTGGLTFGWHVYPTWEYSFNPAREEKPYVFYVTHPSGEFSPESTLLIAALIEGWEIGLPPHLR